MEHEFELYQQIKKYLEGLGYPSNSIVPEYLAPNDNRVDVVIKSDKDVLIAIELKKKLFINTSSKEELAYHPITRQLQKNAEELGAKYYILSDGKEHVWMKTGINGRPETTIEIKYSNFDATTLSNAEFTKFIVAHVFEYIKNFPITGDPLYDNSIILYSRLIQETKNNQIVPVDVKEIIGRNLINEKIAKSYSIQEVFTEALRRLGEVRLLENKNAVLEFIDEYFELYRREWNVPRWLADFMVKLFMFDQNAQLIDIFTRNGVTTSAAYLNQYKNVLSYYAQQNELYWIKIQQILGRGKENELRFEPGLLRGELNTLPKQFAKGILLAPPFNLKFDFFHTSYLTSLGVKDSNSLYLEASFNALQNGGKTIAIVMDGFLLSSLYLKSRKHFLSVAQIEAIISLPSDTFKPYSVVKTSIIVLKKTAPNKNSKTFFASLEDVPKNNPINCRDDKNINSILRNYENAISDKKIEMNKLGFFVKELNAENFHFSKYWFGGKQGDKVQLDSGFIAIPLKELVVEISRGNTIVNDPENGDIPFVSPASIRGLLLKNVELSYTSESKLPRGKIRRVEVNDVIVNIIGPYRGKAALATSDVTGFPINRHLIAIKANSTLITAEYLAIALNSKYVQEQFLDKSSGAVIQSLNLASFEEIYLPVPSLEEQKRIYNEYSYLLDELTKIKNRSAELEGELSEKLSTLGKGGKKP